MGGIAVPQTTANSTVEHSAAKAVNDASDFPVSRMDDSSHLSPLSSTGVAEGSSNVRRREADAGIRLAGDEWVDDHETLPPAYGDIRR